MHSLTSPQQFVSFDSEWDFARSDFRFEVLHMASSGSNRAGPEHRGVTEHVSPGCSATGPQQSGQKQRGDPEHVVPDLREQLEKGGAAEHAPPESSKICSVSKSAGNATSIPDAGQMSSGSNIAGLEHRGVTEHVSPGCSATGPQQSDQIHRRVSPVCNDDDDSDGYSDRKNRGSDSDDEIPDTITIEYRFPSGENACSSMSISFDRGLSCGHLWLHLRACGVTWIMRNSPWVLR